MAIKNLLTPDNLGNEFDLGVAEANKIHLKLDGTTIVRDGAGLLSAPAGSAAGAIAGDLKPGIQAADHNHWYLLDGRAKASLPAAAQAAATLLGIGATLPNAAGRFLKQETLLAAGGAATAVIAQANLPAVSLTSATAPAHAHTTDTQGAHTHTEAAAGNHVHNVSTMDNGGQNDASVAQANNATVNSGVNTWPAGAHTHTINAAAGHTHTAAAAGAHSHSVPLGGSGTPVPIDPPWLGVNWFIYLT